MSPATDTLTAHLLAIVRRVQSQLGSDGLANDPGTRFADVLDSMGLVEFVAILASECGVPPSAIDGCVHRRFGTIADLATAMSAAGLQVDPARRAGPEPVPARLPGLAPLPCWLSAIALHLPQTIQPAAAINEALGRPLGWLENHAGIESRRLWVVEDPLAGAMSAAADCLREAELPATDVGALLVTAEAPPLLAGLSAALHHRLGLRPDAVALDVGNACAGYLAALWAAESLLPRVGPVLVVTVEAPSHFLEVRPGPAGEAAALFGDGAAATLLCDHPIGRHPVPLAGVLLGVDGSAGDMVRVERSAAGAVELHMAGPRLAGRAITAMAEGVRALAGRYGLRVNDLEAVVCHGGNGRLPALLARQLDLAQGRVWSETPRTGNLGSASLPAAWAAHRPPPHGPVAWAAVGAGVAWGAAITGVEWE
jgi:3-oxoacyl-[acyl-carrier-protein] synthase-3